MTWRSGGAPFLRWWPSGPGAVNEPRPGDGAATPILDTFSDGW